MLALSQSCLDFQKSQCNVATLLICEMFRNVQAKIAVQAGIVPCLLVQGSRCPGYQRSTYTTFIGK